MTASFENATLDASSMPVAYTEYGLDARLGSHNQLIIESHDRCKYLGLKAFEPCDFSAQMLADFRITLERNARLIAQATSVVEMLGKRVGDFGSMIVLTDGTGTILRTRCQSTFIEYAERVALRPGVSWAESSKGTNAVGTALILETDIFVHGNEHYIQSNHFLSCAASPIMDHSGNVIGVLDVSGDRRSFHPHTMMLVEMCARTIENHWFRDKFRQSLQMHFHTQGELIGTAEEGIIAFGEDGKILGTNRAGLKILEISASALRIQGLRMLFGLGFGELMDKLRLASFTPLKMYQSNGKELFVRVSWNEATISTNTLNPQFGHVHSSPALSAPSLPLQNATPNARKAAYQLDELDFGDAQVRSVTQKVRHVIDKDISILILGETGTGKELLANAIHQFSQRRDRPFVAINCASIPEQLIESELFGYEEGAFTGAKRKGATGKLLQANGGTLFLDEIGDMPLSLQARLLRVLQERKVVPLGGHRSMDIDINLICATHRNLRELIEQRGFRDDLYYRINGISVRLPRLRERTDLAALCQRILRELAPHRVLSIQTALMEAFLRYSWPGNLRQLNNVLKTAAIMASDTHEITAEHLADDFLEELSALITDASVKSDAASSASVAELIEQPPATFELSGRWGVSSTPASPPSTMDNMEQVEIATIRRALEACAGNVSTAAKLLNISRNTIYRKLNKKE
ncbi:MAG: sigma-54-dependent Fis family transcriptional regulator [Rhodoferax sp.]|nr:sigma-54-dependent Fis family transcriptional regulator [Rhodoferax sp.]